MSTRSLLHLIFLLKLCFVIAMFKVHLKCQLWVSSISVPRKSESQRAFIPLKSESVHQKRTEGHQAFYLTLHTSQPHLFSGLGMTAHSICFPTCSLPGKAIKAGPISGAAPASSKRGSWGGGNHLVLVLL